jgi:hypothetical protein
MFSGGNGCLDCPAYILDEQGHNSNVIGLECSNDDEAKERAAQLVDRHDVARRPGGSTWAISVRGDQLHGLSPQANPALLAS